MGIPSAFVNDVNNVEFAKTLSMQNGRFVRSIIMEQKKCGDALTKLVRRLYSLEYLNNDTHDNLVFDVEQLYVKFPSPVSLNMTNLADQLNNLSGIVDAFADVMDIHPDDADMGKAIFKHKMYEKFMVNLDWKIVADIMDTVKIAIGRRKIKSAITTGTTDLNSNDTSDNIPQYNDQDSNMNTGSSDGNFGSGGEDPSQDQSSPPSPTF